MSRTGANFQPNVPYGNPPNIQRKPNAKRRVSGKDQIVNSEATKAEISKISEISSPALVAAESKGAPVISRRTDIQSLLEKPFSLKITTVENGCLTSPKSERATLDWRCCSSRASSLVHLLSQPVANNEQPVYVVVNQGQCKMSKSASVGKPAPDFSAMAVVNGEFKTVKLADYRGKYAVLFFWPRDFTFVCPTEIIAFSDRAGDFRKINCEIIGCSTDSHFTHFAWVQQPRKEGGLGEMDIPLLSDSTHEIARAYGVLKEDEGLAYRGLFIIDGNGILRQVTINDLPVGRDVDETMRLVQAFQYTDAHGEVCPAGWRPGKATIKPGMRESKAFFEKSAT